MNALTNNTATLFRRYLWLLDVIYSAGRITLDEIRVRWQRNEMSGGEELPRKTFENHRKAVEELFDVNIACDRRTNEYYVECGDDLVREASGLLQGRRDHHRVLRFEEIAGQWRADGQRPVRQQRGGRDHPAGDAVPPDPADGLRGARATLRPTLRNPGHGNQTRQRPPVEALQGR